MAIITISRELGSGGTDVARLVAERLGYRLVNRELVDMIAQKLGARPEEASQLDETAMGGLTAFIDGIIRAMAGERLTAESYRYVAARALREVARADNAIILGRAGQVVLARQPHALHVHIWAPLATRAERIRRTRGVTEAEARRLVEQSDANRRGYVSQVGQVDWADKALYDLVINTHRLSVEAAAEVIICAARGRGAEPLARSEDAGA